MRRLDNFLLELPIGYYIGFKSIKQAVHYRNKIKSNGNIWTIDGQLIKESYLNQILKELETKEGVNNINEEEKIEQSVN